MRALQPAELPQRLRNSYNFKSQKIEQRGKIRMATISRTCRRCLKTHRVTVNSVRNCLKLKTLRAICFSCLGQSQKGSNHPSWKGGRAIHQTGYIRVKAWEHPYADKDGYVLEHRLKMEKKLGRFLLPIETVHHKNGKRDDNRLSNLELRIGHHGQGQRYNDLTVKDLNVLIGFLQQLIRKKTDGVLL